MHSTTFLTGAALLLTGTSLASDVTKIQTVTQTVSASSSVSRPLSTGSPSNGKPNPYGASNFNVYDLYELHGTVTPDVSIITANPTATVYKIACPLQTQSSAPSACGDLTAPLTLTQGPSILKFASTTATANATQTLDFSCKIDGTKAATCVVDIADNNNKNNKTDLKTTLTLSGTDMFSYVPARVTGGAYRLSNGTAPHATGSGFGSGVAKPTGLQTTTGKTGPKPTTTSSVGPQHTGAASAHAPVLAGAGAFAGLAMAVLAL